MTKKRNRTSHYWLNLSCLNGQKPKIKVQLSVNVEESFKVVEDSTIGSWFFEKK